MRLDTVAHEPAEELAAHAEPATSFDDHARCLPLQSRRVDRPFARHDQRGTRRTLVEADAVEHELGTPKQLASERGERGAEPPAGARTGHVAVGLELGERREPLLQLDDRVGVRALLRAEDASRSTLAEQRVPHVARHTHRHAAKSVTEHGGHADPAVDGGDAPHADEKRLHAMLERGEDQLTHALTRRAQRVALVPTQARQADRGRALDDARAVG